MHKLVGHTIPDRAGSDRYKLKDTGTDIYNYRQTQRQSVYECKLA